jgi:hypothetical protein
MNCASKKAYVSKRKIERYQEEREKFDEKIRVWKESGADPATIPEMNDLSSSDDEKKKEQPLGAGGLEEQKMPA